MIVYAYLGSMKCKEHIGLRPMRIYLVDDVEHNRTFISSYDMIILITRSARTKSAHDP